MVMFHDIHDTHDMHHVSLYGSLYVSLYGSLYGSLCEHSPVVLELTSQCSNLHKGQATPMRGKEKWSFSTRISGIDICSGLPKASRIIETKQKPLVFCVVLGGALRNNRNLACFFCRLVLLLSTYLRHATSGVQWGGVR